MADKFRACLLPWRVWPWGLTLTHSDTDTVPDCVVQFGALVARSDPPFESIWVRVDFELGGFARTTPHRDDEDLRAASGYDITPLSQYDGLTGGDEQETAEWLRTGLCPDPGLYFASDSSWLASVRQSWAAAQRTSRTANEAVHFVIDGRDGYVEVIAAGFSWTAWSTDSSGHPAEATPPVAAGDWDPRSSS